MFNTHVTDEDVNIPAILASGTVDLPLAMAHDSCVLTCCSIDNSLPVETYTLDGAHTYMLRHCAPLYVCNKSERMKSVYCTTGVRHMAGPI